jgi:DHA2 family metal-tetracycline-proton antiporter-like MFS transporter
MVISNNARQRTVILPIICVALFLSVLNASALGVMLPDIAAGLSVDSGQLGWIMTGFLLVFGIAIPFYGRLADRHGAKPLFLLGLNLFAMGSLVCALAPSFEILLLGRVIQASGGAAVRGLGMTLASRAYGPESSGKVLGILAATIGGASAIGPLLGGILSGSLGWQSVFYINTGAVLLAPVAWRILPSDEPRTARSLDVWGGIALGLVVVGALLAPSAWARSGWNSWPVLIGGSAFVFGLVVLVYRQTHSNFPFIPTAFLQNRRYVALVGISFTVMAANLATLIGLPIMVAAVHDLTAIQVGLVMLPGAVSSAAFGVLAGQITDRKGGRQPMLVGAPVMLVAVLGLSTYAGASVWGVAVCAGLLGVGFGLTNTPLAAMISNTMRGPLLASALSINSMLFFLAGSFGATALIAVAGTRSTPLNNPFNPWYSGVAPGFSDGFLILALPVLAALVLALVVPLLSGPAVVGSSAEVDAPATVGDATPGWTPDCSVPWAPQCAEYLEVNRAEAV